MSTWEQEHAEALEVLADLVEGVDWGDPAEEERLLAELTARSALRRWWDEHVAHWFY